VSPRGVISRIERGKTKKDPPKYFCSFSFVLREAISRTRELVAIVTYSRDPVNLGVASNIREEEEEEEEEEESVVQEARLTRGDEDDARNERARGRGCAAVRRNGSVRTAAAAPARLQDAPRCARSESQVRERRAVQKAEPRERGESIAEGRVKCAYWARKDH